MKPLLLVGLFLASWMVLGCGSEPAVVPPTPEETISRIESSPDMPPEAKAQAKAQIEAMNRQQEALTKAQGR